MPLTLALLKAFYPTLSPWLAAYAIGALVLEPEFDAMQTRLRTEAALAQELFDRTLFALEWPSEIIGPKPAQEDIQRWSRHYHKRASEWKDWYPPEVGVLSLPLARVACQRTNAWWDGALRNRYATALTWIGYLVIGAVFVFGAVRQHRVLEAAAVAALLAPIVGWIQRTRRRQKASAASRMRLFHWTKRVSEQGASGSLSDSALEQVSMEIQRETYGQRRDSPLVPRWLYKWSRDENEESVRAAVVALAKSIAPSSS